MGRAIGDSGIMHDKLEDRSARGRASYKPAPFLLKLRSPDEAQLRSPDEAQRNPGSEFARSRSRISALCAYIRATLASSGLRLPDPVIAI